VLVAGGVLAEDVTALSDLAVAQIVCTITAAEPKAPSRVVLSDRLGHHRGPLTCPVTGFSTDR
jgi:hypothetical protein